MAMQLGTGRVMADINVTPMVDVVLVLLIIFMVAAPMIQQGVQVELPKAQSAALPSEESHAVLSITREREIFLGTANIPRKELHDRLAGNLKLQREQQLYLHADHSLPYGFVVDIMAAIQAAGIAHVGMVTDPTSVPVRSP